MSVWLTPDLEPIVGGTYFPPEDSYGRMGFSSVLKMLADKVPPPTHTYLIPISQHSVEEPAAGGEATGHRTQ